MRKFTTIEKNKTRAKTKAAISAGILTPTTCQKCGAKDNIHVHHEDYENHLDVRWLCRKHHVEYHAAVRSLNGRIITGFFDGWVKGFTVEQIINNDKGPFYYTIELSPYYSRQLYWLMEKVGGSASYTMVSALDALYYKVSDKRKGRQPECN